jgi:DNA-binding CsgD family transcriptional regulator
MKDQSLILKEMTTIWTNQDFGQNTNKSQLAEQLNERLMSFFSVGDYYYYVLDLKTLTFDYMSNGIQKILGYAPEEVSVASMLPLIHPDDYPYFVRFEEKVMQFFSVLTPEEVFNYKVRYDYRLRAKSGKYIRILQQVVTAETDENGSIVKTIGLHTNINDLKIVSEPVLSFIGLNGAPNYESIRIDDDLHRPGSSESKFTNREQEILRKIIDGKTSNEIASDFFISKDTVDTHRRNMLKKCQAKNTPELIKLAVQYGWV